MVEALGDPLELTDVDRLLLLEYAEAKGLSVVDLGPTLVEVLLPKDRQAGLNY
ncbi:hypothetical protein SynBIOSE41_01240 [Synechococcus sp. BIOS-E4-1]|uniref:hypothetical protein n=1 Tax=Synechococcus sp. BIOS-E4-1 TaxID=1400864 RepID=UPI0016443FA5|nr:hypothetical protein [Synechococcus sp. BIOS-E4-1]QNI53760.1 hypothetical protein SynBIOSE41_01240 [Synechococcus sp. BIOS-E4-1]